MVGYLTDDELHKPRELKVEGICVAGNRSMRTRSTFANGQISASTELVSVYRAC
jgi:hypothetical protein